MSNNYILHRVGRYGNFKFSVGIILVPPPTPPTPKSQPSLHSLRINLTVHLELWPCNHLIWCNATLWGKGQKHQFYSCSMTTYKSHWGIFRSSQCTTTGVPKAVVCAISGIVHIKEPLLLIGKSSPCGGIGSSSLAIWVVLYHMFDANITINIMCWECR